MEASEKATKYSTTDPDTVGEKSKHVRRTSSSSRQSVASSKKSTMSRAKEDDVSPKGKEEGRTTDPDQLLRTMMSSQREESKIEKAKLQTMSQEIITRLHHSIQLQKTDAFLVSKNLPPLPGSRSPPKVSTIPTGKGFEIAANESHTKQTNNGYSRTPLGGFYAH